MVNMAKASQRRIEQNKERIMLAHAGTNCPVGFPLSAARPTISRLALITRAASEKRPAGVYAQGLGKT